MEIISDGDLFPKRRPSNKYILYVTLFMLSLIWISCLKEKGRGDCPVVYQVTIGIKDKNYDNAGDIPGWPLKDEQLPFKTYVSTLTYYLRNEATKVVEQNVPAYPVANDDRQQVLNLAEVPSGRYILSTFGNNRDGVEDYDGTLSYNLHPTGTEGVDTYLLSDTIDLIPNRPVGHLDLQRTKGVLYLSLENLPDSVDRIESQITGIYQHVDQNQGYRGETVVKKVFTGDFSPAADLLIALAPTVIGKSSVVRLALYTKDSALPFMFIPDFGVAIKRNQVTAFRLNFNPNGGIEVWIAVGGAWTKLHDMDITMI